MTGNGPAEELVDLIGSRFGKNTYIFVCIRERRFNDRFDLVLIQSAKSSGNMTEADDRVTADLVVPMASELDTDLLCIGGIGRGESDSDWDELELFRIVPDDRCVHIIVRELFEVLKFHGRDLLYFILQWMMSCVNEAKNHIRMGVTTRSGIRRDVNEIYRKELMMISYGLYHPKSGVISPSV
jgi:hypothetical protein